MTSYIMPKAKELAEQTLKEVNNGVLLQLVSEMLDYIEDDIMTPKEQRKILQFRDWANEYIDERIDAQEKEGRDLRTLIAKACLYD